MRTDPAFTEGQRVYHRWREESGIYVSPDARDQTFSYVVFDSHDEELRVSTAELVPTTAIED